MKILVVLVAVFACSCSVLCGVSADASSKPKSIFGKKPVRRLTKFRKDLESFPTPAFFTKECSRGFECPGSANRDPFCIPLTFVCDGENDCFDGRDQKATACKSLIRSRSSSTNCSLPDGIVKCPESSTCIKLEQVCDGKIDCPGTGSDEWSNCEILCAKENNPCLSKDITKDEKPANCYPDLETRSAKCLCPKGYQLSSAGAGASCADIDECSLTNRTVCSQICVNSLGSYDCRCGTGFQLKANESCVAENPRPILIIAEQNALISKVLDEKENTNSHNLSTDSPVYLTFDARSGIVFWTNSVYEKEQVLSASIDPVTGEWIKKNETGFSGAVILDLSITTNITERRRLPIPESLPEGIAFDWIAKNLYIAETLVGIIHICSVLSPTAPFLCTSILKTANGTTTARPRDIAVDPNEGLLFYSDWTPGSEGIVRAGLDGSSRTRILTQNLQWPNGIALDYFPKRLYFVDAGTDRIESVNYDGSRRIVHAAGQIKHPFGIDVFGDDVYFTDWHLSEIRKFSKLSPHNGTTLTGTKFGLMNGLAVFHIANQPILRSNDCLNANCSYICVLVKNGFRCICPADVEHRGNCTENHTVPETVTEGSLVPAETEIKEIPIIEKPTPTTETISLGAKTNENKIIEEPDQSLSFRLSIIFAIVGLCLALGVIMYRKMFGKLPILSRPLHDIENGLTVHYVPDNNAGVEEQQR